MISLFSLEPDEITLDISGILVWDNATFQQQFLKAFMRALFHTRHGYLPYCVLLMLTLLLFVLPASWQQLLAYQRESIATGELWRLLSGHLLHSNGYHLLLNGGGLLIIMLLHVTYQRQLALVWQCLFNAVMISSLLLWLQPQVQQYVGLSGVLHGLLFFGALMDIKTAKTGGVLLTIGILAKIAYEQYQGPDAELGRLIDATVAIDAHLYGVISGTILFGLVFLKPLFTTKQQAEVKPNND